MKEIKKLSFLCVPCERSEKGMEFKMKIILASKSPRRKELLSLIVSKFDVIASDVDEKLEDGLTLQEQVIRLSYMKAKNVYEKTQGNRIVIGSDTIYLLHRLKHQFLPL